MCFSARCACDRKSIPRKPFLTPFSWRKPISKHFSSALFPWRWSRLLWHDSADDCCRTVGAITVLYSTQLNLISRSSKNTHIQFRAQDWITECVSSRARAWGESHQRRRLRRLCVLVCARLRCHQFQNADRRLEIGAVPDTQSCFKTFPLWEKREIDRFGIEISVTQISKVKRRKIAKGRGSSLSATAVCPRLWR